MIAPLVGELFQPTFQKIMPIHLTTIRSSRALVPHPQSIAQPGQGVCEPGDDSVRAAQHDADRRELEQGGICGTHSATHLACYEDPGARTG